MLVPSRNTTFLFVFIAAAILLITSGIRLSLGLFVNPIATQSDISIVDLSFALAMTQLMWGVSQPITGALADRFGARWVICGGTILLAVACALVPLLLTPLGLVFTLGILLAFGAGAGSFSVLMGQVANNISPQYRGTASGIINAGSSFGQFLFAPLLQSLIVSQYFGWQGAMYSLALISLICLPLGFLLTRKNSLTPPPAHSEMQQSLGQVVKFALKDRSYWLIHIRFFHLWISYRLFGYPFTHRNYFSGIKIQCGILVIGIDWVIQCYRQFDCRVVRRAFSQ